jgi:hypothetical protein
MLVAEMDRDRIQKIGRAASSALRVHEYLQKKPLVGIGAVADELKLSIPTVTVALDHLVQLGIAKEVCGKTPSPRLRILTLSENSE